MPNYASKIIEIAKSQVGYHEKASNANLDDNTANSGSANYNKYARDFDTKYQDFYNYRKNPCEWCDIFTDWLFVTAFGEDEALRLLCQPKKSAGAGCVFSYGYYKKKKQVGKEPKIGSQIFFSKDGTEKGICHTGIVVGVDANKVYTIEGNKGNKVTECSYKHGDSSIYGYGYPSYDEEPLKGNSEPIKAIDEPVDYYVIAKGDTLSAIAKSHKTTVSKLVEINGIKDKNKIIAGQKIKIPKVESVASKKAMIGKVITKNSNLNIRGTKELRSDNKNVVGELIKGKSYEFSEADSAWCKLADGRGYVSAKYIRF